MAATAAAIASLIGTGVGVGTSLFGGRGTQQRTDIMEQQLADARQNALAAQISAAQTGRLGRAGYSDAMGGGFQYDPTTNTWKSTLGDLPKAEQTAALQAAISRNTTDLRQAQGANERADVNAARAQPLIDAARIRLSQFKPQTTDELTGLLTEKAVDANNQTYRPLIADTLRSFARTGTAAGDVLGKLGTSQSADLRRSLIDARIAGMSNVDQMNNQRRAGLATDLGTAMTAGTPQFQYPGVQPSTGNKDMLAALTARANSAGYTSALGQSGIANANKQQQDASTGYAASIPKDSPGLTNLYAGSQQISNLFKDENVKGLLGSLFGPKKVDDTWQTQTPGRFNSQDDTF